MREQVRIECLLKVRVKGLISLKTHVYFIFRVLLRLAYSWTLEPFKIHSVDSGLGRTRWAPAHYLVNLRFQGFTRTVCTDISGLASNGLSAGVEFGQGKYTSGLKWLKLTSSEVTKCSVGSKLTIYRVLWVNKLSAVNSTCNIMLITTKCTFLSLKNSNNLGYNEVLKMTANEADS